MIRVHGDVRRINVDALDHKAVYAMVYDIMNDGQRKRYEEFLEIDFSFEIEGLARFRVNAFNQNRGAGAVFRTIPSVILTLEATECAQDFCRTGHETTRLGAGHWAHRFWQIDHAGGDGGLPQ